MIVLIVAWKKKSAYFQLKKHIYLGSIWITAVIQTKAPFGAKMQCTSHLANPSFQQGQPSPTHLGLKQTSQANISEMDVWTNIY